MAMDMTSAWTRLCGGPSDGVVLAVDFDGSGRREATFRDLVRNLPGGLAVWHAVSPPYEPEPELSPDEYVAWWLDLPGGPATRVRAVLGYCAGSVFASAIADAIADRTGVRPPVVLFNPGVPTVATLDRDFAGIVAGLTILSDEERDALRARVTHAKARHGEDFHALCDEYVALYLRACATSFERFGIDPEVGGQLTELFRAYVAYLVAARRAGYRPEWAVATAFTAKEQAGTGFAGDEKVLDVSRADLLRDGATAEAAYRVLTARELEPS